MKLIKARIRGLDPLTESRWFDLNPKLNLFKFPEARQGRNFLRILQTINPTYPVKTVKPFADFPKYTEQNGYSKYINPAKRTIALAVFSATSGLVKELAACSDLLYETDRIEVGRRLDYSRWINFVELASSTRWSEISADMATLRDETRQYDPDMAQLLSELTDSLQPSDRIKDKVKNELVHWLRDLPPEVRQNSQQLIDRVLAGVHRVDHFEAARVIVRSRMPLFVVVGHSHISANDLGTNAITGLHQDSASFQHLLQLIAKRAKSIGQKSVSEERAFLKELNEQLSAVQPPSMMMYLEKTTSGELLLKNDKPAPKASDVSLFSLRQIQAKACLAIALSRIVYQTESILLFDEPEKGFPESLQKDLIDFIIKISETSQCLYAYSRDKTFPQNAAGRQYSAAELDMVAD